jgi:putative oxidoreductase
MNNQAINPSALRSAGLLVLRLVVGTTFLVHGLHKLIHLSAAEEFFASVGIPAPDLMAPVVSITEAAGGVLLIVGLATPLVGAALSLDMLVALATVNIDHGFFAEDGGMELALLLGGASLALVLAGAGRFSLDAALDLPRSVSRRVRAGNSMRFGAPVSKTR